MKSAKLFLINKIPRKYLIILSFLFVKIFSIFFYGHKFYCPICQKSFWKFFDYGRPIRKNVLCPGCLSLERHRLLWLFFKDKTNFFKDNIRLLHIAPEQAFYKKIKKMNNVDYVTSDLESPLAQVKADIKNLPFDDNEFDVLICNHVLEHIDDDKKAMQEIWRVLKPNAWAIVQVPMDLSRIKTFEDKNITSPKDREKYFGQHDHLRLYGLDYKDRLEQAGFKVDAIDYLTLLSDNRKKYLALPKKELIYLLRK